MAELPKIEIGSVKVMRSYDYCHFEVCLSSSEATTPEGVDELRKAAARLADKAVHQYQVAKDAMKRGDMMAEKWRLNDALEKPEGERTPAEKAVIKFHQDENFARRFRYDYDDDFEYPDFDDEE
jgi:hypothetical protein